MPQYTIATCTHPLPFQVSAFLESLLPERVSQEKVN